MRKSLVWVLGLAEAWALAACGGGNGRTVDAGAIDAPSSSEDAMSDAAIDASLGITSPPPCGFTEALDGSNDATAEASGLMIGTTDQSLCGTINTGHFSGDTGTVDIDSYRVTVDVTTGLVVRLFGTAGLESAHDVSVSVLDAQQGLVGSGTFRPAASDHAAFLTQVAPGDYTILITASNPAALSTAVDYKIELAPDPVARCPAITAAAAYTEAGDGADSAGNDVVSVSFGDPEPYALTAASDAPEPTGLTIGAVTPLRITGTSGNVDAPGDYKDRDAYLIHTGPVTNELSLRLGWADEANDFDFLVFPADHVEPVGDGSSLVAREEYNVVPVAPNTAYWIWIGSSDSSTALPATYDLSLCGTAVVEVRR